MRHHPTHLIRQHRRYRNSPWGAAVLAALAFAAIAGWGWMSTGDSAQWSAQSLKEINHARHAACRRTVTLHVGTLETYQAKPAQVCTWLRDTPPPQDGFSESKLPEPKFQKSAISAWVNASVSKVIVKPIPGQREVDNTGKLVRLLKDPKDGIEVLGKADAVTVIYNALQNKTGNVKVNLSTAKATAGFDDKVVPAPPLTYVAAPDEKWVDVNLSTHTVSAYLGSKLLLGPVPVVHGHRLAPTATGVFKIYSRVPFQNMTGVGFDGPYSEPAPYIQYFHQGFALHPAPWRKSFVYTPETGSHGCVNMRPDDAKWLWDWADTNTTVVSHK